MDDFLRKVSHSSDGSGGESDLFKHATDFLHSHGSGAHAPAPAHQGGAPAPAPAPGAAAEKTNYKQVYGSAQTLYQGLQDKLSGKPSSIDNHQLAEAAADVLKAANKAGFAKDSQYGQYFEKAASSGTPAAPAHQGGAPAPAPGSVAEKTNYKQVYGSSQTLYQGLQDKLSGKPSNIDNHQLAEAAADVLKAANKAGFAKDSQYGQYFDKAETYLHHYGASKGTAGVPPVAAPGAPSTGAPPSAPPYQ